MTSSWQQQALNACDQELCQKLKILLEKNVDRHIKQEGLIDNFYLPLFFKFYDQIATTDNKTIVIGINAPQGGGKSTLTSYLVQLFEYCELNAVTLSIDDFYLTRKGQIQIATENSENSYLQQRGYPGTHDIELGVEILSTLKTTYSNESILLPRYDKSKHQGQGDRAEKEKWPKVQLPVDIVLLEGWMLGFQTLSLDLISDENLLEINRLLKNYSKWHKFLDTFVYLYPKDPVTVIDWRIEAEERMKATGLPGMSTSDIRKYAEKFLPAYRLYSPHLVNNPPTVDNFLNIEIGKNRLPINI
jgi:D-glycerate 3-kinase